MSKDCDRCGDEITGINRVHKVCLECYEMVGGAPSAIHMICPVCGMHWIRPSVRLCEACFKDYPLDQMYEA